MDPWPLTPTSRKHQRSMGSWVPKGNEGIWASRSCFVDGILKAREGNRLPRDRSPVTVLAFSHPSRLALPMDITHPHRVSCSVNFGSMRE